MKTEITIWLRDDVPAELASIIPNFWHEGEPVVAVAHVPDHVIHNPHYELVSSLASNHPKTTPDPRAMWFSDGGLGLFGSNSAIFIDHPTGDGHIVVCSCI
mgnify:CR=1 FL=1